MAIDRSNRFGSAKRQKFRIGDIVFIPRFNCEATILGSIRDICEKSAVTDCFGIKLENGAKSYWHHQDEMDLVEKFEQRT